MEQFRSRPIADEIAAGEPLPTAPAVSAQRILGKAAERFAPPDRLAPPRPGTENERYVDFADSPLKLAFRGAGLNFSIAAHAGRAHAAGSESRLIDDLRYGAAATAPGVENGELALLRVRYKRPGETARTLMEQPILGASRTEFAAAPEEARFATAVAGFGQILRGDEHVAAAARASRGEDRFGYRAEFLRLVELAKRARGCGAYDQRDTA